MDDLKFGTRNKRGDYTPNTPLEVAPIVVWPPKPLKFLAWLPGYFFPWNLLFMATALVIWFYLTPSKQTMQTLDWHWIGFIWLRNSAIVFALYGFLELRLYIRRTQGNRFKFNAIFPVDKPSDVFMFRSQNIDNAVRSEWGLHLFDMHFAMGNLQQIVSSQSAAWLAAQAAQLDPL